MKILKVAFIFILLLNMYSLAWPAELGVARETEAIFMAKKAYADGFYEVSLEILEGFKKDFPHSLKAVETRILTAQCYFFQGRYLESLNILEGLLADPGAKNFRDAIYFWIAEVHFKGNNFEKAAEFYDLVVQDFPQSSFVPAAYYSLGWSFSQVDKYSLALKSFQSLLDKFPDEPQSKDAAFKIIECLYNLKEYSILCDRVRPYFKLYAGDSLRLSYLYFYLAESDYYLDSLQDAASNYLKVSQMAVDDKVRSLAKLGLAWSYLKLKKYKEAEEVLAEIKQSSLDKKGADILLLGEAVLMSINNRIYEAKKIYDQLISLSSDPVVLIQAYLGKADALYNLAEYAQSVQVYKEGLAKIDKTSVSGELMDKLRYNLGLAYIKQGEWKLAVEELKNLAASSSNQDVRANALSQAGDVYQDNGEFAKAEEIYISILKDFPNYSANDYVQYQLGSAQLKKTDLMQAAVSFRLLARNYTQSKLLDDAAYSLGLVCLQKEDYTAGCDILMKFQDEFKDSPLCAQALYLLGTCFMNLNKFNEALRVFMDIPKIYPQNIELLQKAEYGIADCYYKLGQEKEAISRFNFLRTKYPDSKLAPEIMWWLAQYYYQHDDLNLARRYFSSLAKDFPDSDLTADAFYALGLSFSDEGKLEQAVDNFRMAFKLGNVEVRGQAAVAIGDTYYRAEKFEEALIQYKKMIKDAPDLDKLFFSRVAETSYKIGDYAEAKLFYTKALEVADTKEIASIRFSLAEVLEANAEFDAAIQQYLSVGESYAGSVQLVRALLRAAKLYEDKENFKEALKIYKRIVQQGTVEAGFAQERIDWIKAR